MKWVAGLGAGVFDRMLPTNPSSPGPPDENELAESLDFSATSTDEALANTRIALLPLLMLHWVPRSLLLPNRDPSRIPPRGILSSCSRAANILGRLLCVTKNTNESLGVQGFGLGGRVWGLGSWFRVWSLGSDTPM